MAIDTPPPNKTAARFAPQESPRRRIIFAAAALMLALLAVTVPVWIGGHSGRAISAETGPAPEPTSVPNARPSASFDRGHAPWFFGFLEFDWNPDAPGGVPGFDPWPSDVKRR